jgi:N-acetylneuraminic acid mutarotase
MIIWGGLRAGSNPGGLYDPATDTWTSVSLTGAPVQRAFHSCVWTGSEMIVWAGAVINSSAFIGEPGGGRYDPVSNSWSPLSSAGAPSERGRHTTVWTGSEMIVFGGKASQGGISLGTVNDGARYSPATDSWLPLPLPDAPSPRVDSSVVWTGTEMIVWGGQGTTNAAAGDGGRYFPAQNAWVPAAGGPISYSHSAVWTGSRMLLFGGSDGPNLFNRLWSYLPTPPLVLYQKP